MSLFPPTKRRVTHNVTGSKSGKSLVPSLKRGSTSASSPAPIKPKRGRCASCGKSKF